MSVNKNALLRYNIIDRCLQNSSRKYSVKDLISECNIELSNYYCEEIKISQSQLYKDLEFMKSEVGFNAPIISVQNGKFRYCKYADQDFSIKNQPMTSSEKQLLNEAIATLSRISKIDDKFNDLATRLGAQLNLDNSSKQIIFFQENEFLKGREYINPLYNFIKNQNCVKIKYCTFKDKKIEYNLSPLFLKQFNNRWFIFAFNNIIKKNVNLALDRIEQIEPLDDEYQGYKMDFEKYFSEIIGVSNNPELATERIVIQMDDEVVPYIRTKPLHQSQNIEGNILTITVKRNKELDSAILAYGEQLIVLEPIDYAEAIKQSHTNALEKYKLTRTTINETK